MHLPHAVLLSLLTNYAIAGPSFTRRSADADLEAHEGYLYTRAINPYPHASFEERDLFEPDFTERDVYGTSGKDFHERDLEILLEWDYEDLYALHVRAETKPKPLSKPKGFERIPGLESPNVPHCLPPRWIPILPTNRLARP